MQLIGNNEPNQMWNLSTDEDVNFRVGNKVEAENWDLEKSLPDENSGSSICCVSSFLRKIAMVVRLNINAWTYTSSTRVKKDLNIKEITKEEKPALITIVRKWKTLARSKRDQDYLLFSNIFNKLPRPFYRKCSNVFKSSSHICVMMHLAFQEQIGFHKQDAKVYVCYFDKEDGEKKIEAIAMVTLHSRGPTKPSYLYLEFLASHPKNLISPVNLCEHQVGGAAAKLINHLTKEICPQSNMEQIRLHSTKNAVSFYEKFGFEKKSKCMKLKLSQPK